MNVESQNYLGGAGNRRNVANQNYLGGGSKHTRHTRSGIDTGQDMHRGKSG